jgi:hypothetical protein
MSLFGAAAFTKGVPTCMLLVSAELQVARWRTLAAEEAEERGGGDRTTHWTKTDLMNL